MPKAPVSPIIVNGFTTNPPNGVLVEMQSFNYLFGGYICSNASFSGVGGTGITVFESSGSAFVVLYRMYGSACKVTLSYRTSDGTAVAGVDYTATSGTAVWQVFDSTSKVIRIPLLRTSSVTSSYFNFHIDTIYIGDAPPPGISRAQLYYFQGGACLPFPGPNLNFLVYPALIEFDVTIQRQGRGTLNFVGTPYSVQRPGGTTTVTLQVQRFTGFKGVVGCSFHTTDGTAIAGVAYTAQTGTLSWADGEGGTKNITITILSGGSGTQSFTVDIDTPTGGVTIGTVPTATVNIVAAAPPANPVATGSIPQQLFDLILPNDEDAAAYNAFLFAKSFILQDNIQSFWRNNLTLNSFLSGQVVNGFIGFTGTDSFGGGTDFVDDTSEFVPLPPIAKFQGFIVGG